MKRIALAAVLLLAAAAIAGVARPEGAHAVDAAPASTDSITVSGTGSVSGVPTSATFSFGVDTRAATAKAALAANAREMRQVIAAVKAAGGRQVGTQSVSVSQSLDQNGAPNGLRRLERRLGDGRPRPAGALIDAAVDAGANQVNGPSMSLADQGALYRQALKAAVADARLSAETLAAAAGRSLGKVTTVVEGGGNAPVPMYEKAAASDAGTPIEAGTQETTASVTVTFALGLEHEPGVGRQRRPARTAASVARARAGSGLRPRAEPSAPRSRRRDDIVFSMLTASCGLSWMPPLDRLLVDLEDACVADRPHRRRANLVLEDRHLAEELTGLERSHLLLVAVRLRSGRPRPCRTGRRTCCRPCPPRSTITSWFEYSCPRRMFCSEP